MNLHRHSNHFITQIDTLLMMQRQCVKNLQSTDPQDGFTSFDASMQHLRNVNELIEAWAVGTGEALDSALHRLSLAEAAGQVSKGVVEDVVAPVVDAMGELYTCQAMAIPSPSATD
jgi:hypothetical protein